MWGCIDLRNKPEAPRAPDLHLHHCAVRVWHLQAACLYSTCSGGQGWIQLLSGASMFYTQLPTEEDALGSKS